MIKVFPGSLFFMNHMKVTNNKDYNAASMVGEM